MIRPVSLFVGMVLTAACQSAATAAVPASLIDDSAETIDNLKKQIATALGRDHVTFGQADLTSSSTLTVVPAPLSPRETHSTAMPIRFDLILDGDTCYAVRRDTGEKTVLADVPCRAL